MYKYHRLEYNEHIRRMTLLFVLTELSLLVAIVQQIGFFYLSICVNTADTPPDDYYAMNNEETGICAYYIRTILFIVTTDKGFSGSVCSFDLTILTTVLTFFALDKPHDCFSCLAKDPERNYSIF